MLRSSRLGFSLNRGSSLALPRHQYQHASAAASSVLLRRSARTAGAAGFYSNSSSSSSAGVFCSSSSSAVTLQSRAISWGGIWNGVKEMLPGDRTTKTKEELVEESPEIFEAPPVEVDDYIRPEKTLFESLEDWWDWILGFMSPVEKQVDIMQSFHANGLFWGLVPPLSWGSTFLLYGCIVRLITLVPSLYAHRNSLRVAKIGTPLQEIQQQIKRVKADKTLSSEERKTVQAGYKRMKTALEKEHQCSQLRTGVQLITAPLMMTAFWAIGRMASYEQSLETATFMWVTDLSMPDPTWALPLLCATSFLMNFELTQRLQKGARASTGIYIRWGLRFGIIGFTYFFHSQPAALFLYWMGTSIGGAVQPLLLRNQAFRTYFNFPDPPAAGKLELEGVRAPTFWDKMTKPKEQVEEMARIHSEKLKEAGKVKLLNIDDFEIVVNKKGTSVNKKNKGKASNSNSSPAGNKK